MKRIIPVLLFICCCFCWGGTRAYGQSCSISGQIVDTTMQISLEHASIALMYAKDSILVQSTRSDAEGKFRFEGIGQDHYLLLASYPKYTDYVQEIPIDATKENIDLGALNMILVANLMDEVVVTGSNMITIKGDTIEYDAKQFTIQPNSKVEDLLEQLPGIQVDADGTITAQGKTVEKVLVDGEEFFGDDPTLVTRNIRGDMVDKVQLYDKKSDQATFTGVDDGERTKTINIELKEDSKNGMFGKVDAGKAHNKLYQAQAMINSFKGDRKFAAYGTTGNTNRLGLNWQEAQNYGGGGNVSVSDDGGIYITAGGDELESFDGRYHGDGLPLAHNGGLHFDSKWDDKKHSINANYKIGSLKVEGNSETITQNTLPDGVLDSRSAESFDNYMFRHKADVRYEVNLDTTSSLRVSIDGGLQHSRKSSDYQAETYNGDQIQVNDGRRSLDNESDNKTFNADLLWKKKFKRKGRTFSIGIQPSINNTHTQGYLDAENNFYAGNGSLDSTALTNQQKIQEQENISLRSNITYTEPISEAWSMALNYNLGLQDGTSNLRSYDYDGQDYTDLDSLYSNDYQLKSQSHVISGTLRYVKDKTNLSFTLGWKHITMDQLDRFIGGGLNRSFSDFQPRINLNYKVGPQKSLYLQYGGSATQPSLEQIQPLRSNLDPLNVHIGNADLHPAYRHYISTSYNSYKPISGESFFAYLYVNMYTDPIVQDVFTDEVGKTTFRYVNLQKYAPLNYNASASYGTQLKTLGDIRISLDLSTSGRTDYNQTNGALNKTISNSSNLGLRLSKNVPEKYSFNISIGPSYSIQEASLQTELSNKGFGLRGRAGGRLFLPGKFELFTNASYQHEAATEVFDTPFDRFLWDVGVNKKFLEDESLKVSLTAYDILNQNVGFSRRASYNMNTQKTYTTLHQYIMLSVSWDFNTMKTKD